MNFEKISATLYDVLGYVLPGFIVLFGLAIMDASFLHTHALHLQHLSKHPLFATASAYILGLVTHGVAAWLKTHFPKRFSDEQNRLTPRVLDRVKEELHAFYALPSEVADLSTLEIYQLSEAYAGVSGSFTDRDVYLAHEGFAKSAMVAMFLLADILFATAVHGGASLQTNGLVTSTVHIGWKVTVSSALLCLFVTGVFWKRFLFFSRLKSNYTLLAFLARYLKEKMPSLSAAATSTVSQEASHTVVPVPSEKALIAFADPKNTPPLRNDTVALHKEDDTQTEVVAAAPQNETSALSLPSTPDALQQVRHR